MSGNASSATETDTTTAPAAETNASSGSSGSSGGASSGITVPNYADLLSKMEYGDNSSDTNKLNAIITANPSLFELPSGAIDERALNCSISAPVNFLYLSTIRGGRKMNGEVKEAIVGGCGCGMKGGGSNKYLGGCFTCKKGTKNIALIYSGIHIIIPKLYSKYHTENATKAVKAIKKAKPAKAAKKAKAKTV
jgi:hypothetical protein